MSISYDPMTGEPIETPDEPVTEQAADAVNEAVNDAAETVSEAADNVTETASEVVDNAADAAADAVNEAADNVETAVAQTERRFDPMTGKPIDPNADNNAGGGSDDTGAKIKSEKKAIDPKIFIFAGIGVAVIALLVFLVTTVFMSKRTQVEKAIVKTMKVDSHLYDDCKNLTNILNTSNFSCDVSLEAEDYGSVTGTIAFADKDKQVGFTADIEDVPEFSVLAGIDSKAVKFEVPQFSDYLFVYEYTTDKSGYIADMADKDDLDTVDSLCKLLYEVNTSTSEEFTKKLTKLSKDYEKKLKFEKEEAKKFTVDGKKVNCKAYSTTIEKDLMLDFWDEFTDLYLEEYADYNDALKEIGGTDLKDSLKEVKSEIKSMSDIDLTFYIYKGALAAVNIDAGKNTDEVNILFKGGDYRAQNIVVESDGDEVLELKGSNNKDKETLTISADGDEVMTLTYNYKKGELTVEDEYGDEYEFNVKSSGDSFTISAEDLDVDGDEITLTVEINKSAKLQKYTNSSEFNLGEADEDEFEDLVEELMETLEDNDLDDLLYYLY